MSIYVNSYLNNDEELFIYVYENEGVVWFNIGALTFTLSPEHASKVQAQLAEALESVATPSE